MPRVLNLDKLGRWVCEACETPVDYVVTNPPGGPVFVTEDAFLWGPCNCTAWSAEAMPELARQIEELAMDRSESFRVYRGR
jgi:hypothetical protein